MTPKGRLRREGHRIDYVILPLSWREAAHSVVVEDLETLQLREDHSPAVVSCSFVQSTTDLPYREAPRRRAVRPDPMSMPDEVQVFQHLCQQQPAIAWDTDVDVHYECWSSAVVRLWLDSAPCREPDPCQPYLSTATFHLVQQRKAYRQYLSQEECAKRRCYLVIAFAAFVRATSLFSRSFC